MLSAKALAAALRGDAVGNRVLAPGPGHGPKDRSMSVDLSPDTADEFVVNSFAGDDPIVCRDYVRRLAGMPAWQPKPRMNGHDSVERGLPTHPKFGDAHIVYSYRSTEGELLGVVCRWDFPNGKEIVPAIPIGTGWKWAGMEAPRPLYRLRQLAEDERQVLVVEGEKCADAAAAVMALAVTTWSGGGKAWAKTDWTPLKGRKVILWPDNDKPGREAMQAIGALIEGEVQIIDPHDVPPKWDIADAIADGWDRPRLVAWAREHAKPWEPIADNVLTMPGMAKPVTEDWRVNLVRGNDGMLKPRATTNFRWLLARHPEMEGCFGWNEMAREIHAVKAAPWSKDNWQRHQLADDDVTQCIHWLERHHLSPRPQEVLAALSIAAKDRTYHPIREYFAALKWDGMPRLLGGMWESESIAPFPVEYFGAPDIAIYAICFARWLVSAVARVMMPGCKADCMIVLEGDQERMKSSFLKELATIGGVIYFTDDLHDIESKDAAIQMQGLLIIEIAELNAFQKKDADAIKSWLSRATDRYRPPYGRIAIDFPRQGVFAGTMNPVGTGYLRDPTGARRFWPIPVRQAIDVRRIEADRDQIWAEAVKLYRDGYQWHLTEDEVKAARAITEDRYEDEPWDALIDEFSRGRLDFTTGEVIRALGIPAKDQTQATSRRIGRHLRHRGWEKKRSRVGDGLDYLWSKSET